MQHKPLYRGQQQYRAPSRYMKGPLRTAGLAAVSYGRSCGAEGQPAGRSQARGCRQENRKRRTGNSRRLSAKALRQ